MNTPIATLPLELHFENKNLNIIHFQEPTRCGLCKGFFNSLYLYTIFIGLCQHCFEIMVKGIYPANK